MNISVQAISGDLVRSLDNAMAFLNRGDPRAALKVLETSLASRKIRGMQKE
jgi:hypothetical protein